MRLWRMLNSSVRTSRICVFASVLSFLIALIVQWVPSPSFQAHTKSISALCSHAQAGCIVTGSSDSLLKVWKLGEQGVHHFYPTLNTSRIRLVDDLQEVEAIGMKGRYPLCLALAKLPQADGGNSGFPSLAIILNTPHLRSSDTRCWKHRQPHSHLYAVRKCCMP